jgi:hypothetical protein
MRLIKVLLASAKRIGELFAAQPRRLTDSAFARELQGGANATFV